MDFTLADYLIKSFEIISLHEKCYIIHYALSSFVSCLFYFGVAIFKLTFIKMQNNYISPDFYCIAIVLKRNLTYSFISLPWSLSYA